MENTAARLWRDRVHRNGMRAAWEKAGTRLVTVRSPEKLERHHHSDLCLNELQEPVTVVRLSGQTTLSTAVENQKGAELPQNGGSGTTWIRITGALLLLFDSKRRKKEGCS